MANLNSILIVGPDTVAAASPATPVQLVHACRRWGFSSVVPASWGDELIAAHVIRRCASRDNRPVIQCSCPRVGERLAAHAAMLDDSVYWLLSPPAAVAQYLRVMNEPGDLHITYAGACPGAVDANIDQRISATELMLSISARGIDLAAQPTVFEDIIPPDRRRHFSSAAGVPEPQQLWEAAAFRVTRPPEGDLAVGIAQLLLSDERLLIDISPSLGCICRSTATADSDGSTALLRAPSPVVQDGRIDVARSAPVRVAPTSPASPVEPAVPSRKTHEHTNDLPTAPRQSPARPAFRRQSTWRRQTPRPGVVVARTSGVMVAVADPMVLGGRLQTRVAIATLLVLGTLIVGMIVGRLTAQTPNGPPGGAAPERPAASTQLGRSRSP